ncbi:MAG TPA: type II secretion system minor pseudopilin GspH [Pseudomonadales bacterium]
MLRPIRDRNGRCHSRQPVGGFTLLELLIVLTILGVITATVMLSFTGADQEQALKGAAERLALRIELARQRSLTRNREWGMFVEIDTYRFAEFDPDQRGWVTQGGRPFDRDDLPARVRLRVDLEALDDLPFDEDEDLPQILIFSSGEITPFRILIEPEWRTATWVVASDGLAEVTADREEAL